MSKDAFDLARFVDAQADIYERALAEIAAGAKRSHWMWFIFPQIAGLGHSAMARRYAIVSLEEARAYFVHPLLGKRYRECVATLAALADADAEKVFGPIDAVKLRSSLTLFEVATGDRLLRETLDRWFRGEADTATRHLLSGAA